MFAPRAAKARPPAAASLTSKRGLSHPALKARGDHEQEGAAKNTAAAGATFGVSRDFTRMPLFPPDRASHPQTPPSLTTLPPPGVTQPKLVVGDDHDPLEQEAERAADQVMSMPADARFSPAPRPQLSRISSGDTGAATARRTAEVSADAGEHALRMAHDVLRSPGQSLDAPTRAASERHFGHDFSRVRVHTDAGAATSARALGAQAYTVGDHVVFAEGRYSPATTDGRRLLAHELTHTLQQEGAPGRLVQRKLEVGAGLKLDTHGFATSKAGDVYTCPATVKGSLSNEIFTSLLSSPRVFKIDGTTNAQITSNLNKHTAARAGIVDFASKKKYSFAAGAAFTMNPAYWIVDATGFRPKPGVGRATAIQDLNVHPEKYAIACLAATTLTMEGGGKSPTTDDTAGSVSDWIPGDWGYITNTKFPPGGTAGLEGENIIYTGKDKFWGHFGPGIEYKLLMDWFHQVEGWHGGAKIENQRTRPTVGLV